jgi:hypothetical protein
VCVIAFVVVVCVDVCFCFCREVEVYLLYTVLVFITTVVGAVNNEYQIWIKVICTCLFSLHSCNLLIFTRFLLACDVINSVPAEKFMLLLNRIFQKLHLKVSELSI